MNANLDINAAPYYSTHQQKWCWPGDTATADMNLPEGPIELYSPDDAGTEDLPADANFEVSFLGEYPDMTSAIRDGCLDCGRYMWSRPDEGRYLGYLNSRQGSVALVIY